MNNINDSYVIGTSNGTQQPIQTRDIRIDEIIETSLAIPESLAFSLVGRVEPANPLRDNATMEEIEVYLEQWAFENESGVDVANKISAFLQDPQAEILNLAFSEEEIPVLPNIFNLDAFRRLTIFNVEYCGLMALPLTLFRLPALSQLYLQGSGFASIPEEIEFLADSLQILEVSNCSDLQDVPDAIFSLSNGCRVKLAYSGLSPERIEEMRRRMQELGRQGPRIFFTDEEENAYDVAIAAVRARIEESLQRFSSQGNRRRIELSSPFCHSNHQRSRGIVRNLAFLS